MFIIKARKLTPSAFAPFGDVIDESIYEPELINSGQAKRYSDLAKIELLGDEPHPLVNIVLSQPASWPLEIGLLERHPLGSQAFIPLQKTVFVVIVALPEKNMDENNIRAFVTNGFQGINYRAGVWHAPLSVLNHEARFLVIERGGEGNNYEETSMKLCCKDVESTGN